MKIGHIKAIIISGVLWFFIGSLLLIKGFFLMSRCFTSFEVSTYPLITFFSRYLMDHQKATIYLVLLSSLIGFFKAKLVLSKTVQRNVKRILNQPSPLHIKDLFSPSFLMVIGFMFILGMVLKLFPIYLDVRAAIDIAVGFALLYGFVLYLKCATLLKMQKSRKK